MRTSDAMQRIITYLATKWGLDLAATEAHLQLQNRPYVPLTIEKVGKHLVSVAHYVEEGGDLCADPEIVFFTGARPWVPIEVTQRPPAGYGCFAELSADGSEIAHLSITGQHDLARLADTWARNWQDQGWRVRAYPLYEEEEDGDEEGGSYPVVDHLGARASMIQAAFREGLLFHAVLIGHQVALKAIRAAWGLGNAVGFPNTDRFLPCPSPDAYFMVRRAPETTYHGRMTGDQERGLYMMAIWADNQDLVEKSHGFYLIDLEATLATQDRPEALPSAGLLRRFYGWLNEAVMVPLQEDWMAQLWEKGNETHLIRAVPAFGCASWTVSADEAAWKNIVQEILRAA